MAKTTRYVLSRVGKSLPKMVDAYFLPAVEKLSLQKLIILFGSNHILY